MVIREPFHCPNSNRVSLYESCHACASFSVIKYFISDLGEPFLKHNRKQFHERIFYILSFQNTKSSIISLRFFNRLILRVEPSNSIPIIDKNPIIWLAKGIINQIGSLQWAAKLNDLMQFQLGKVKLFHLLVFEWMVVWQMQWSLTVWGQKVPGTQKSAKFLANFEHLPWSVNQQEVTTS